MMPARKVLRVAGTLCALFAAGIAFAQSAPAFPQRPVRIIVPFQPGGGVDVLIRSVGVELARKWGQPVVIENKAGAGSLIGAEAVARAAPDGYTLLATINQTLTSNRFLYRTLPYDPDKGFTPLSLMVKGDHMILAHPGVQASTLKDLIALGHSRSSNLAYASFGNGSQPQMVYESLNASESIKLLHVPYKGVAPSLAAAVGGEVQLSTGSAAVAGALIKAGKLRPLAIAGKARSPLFPDVPTTAQEGHPELLAPVWYALVGPAGMPSEIAQRITADVNAILREQAFAQTQVAAKGLDLVAGGPAELTAAVQEEVASTAKIVRTIGLKPE